MKQVILVVDDQDAMRHAGRLEELVPTVRAALDPDRGEDDGF